ncbi:DUF1835 domain-containing protein [Mucilaginibacter conchicola]|uniref:DUF1835 domain-containing protein n=1 Tax=Mucilaginibacter conchicola TaxID=2303333 RepID=A0A372NSF0_9SPHI|nr:DUF1835 domain-containing protein [Mucilaginibacter conchicola]RFZ92210.1 DUF1835 domain-containing protein [Mucilaginibacter conchicola]
MSNTLHILNGDSTLYGFERTGIDGDVLIWREVLSEGPLLENINSAAFWKERAAWIGQTFGEPTADYQKKVVEPLARLSEDYKDINLWFEFDLHCQVNMLGVMMLLSQHTDLTERNIYLICPDSFPGKPDFRGMGELTGEELEYLYDNIRVQLSDYDFELATEAWDIYIAKDAVTLEQWLATGRFWGNLHSLKPALSAHLKRLQTNSEGRNYIEQKLLDIYNNGISDRLAIHSEFWKTEPIYGLGDAELNIYLDKLNIV